MSSFLSCAHVCNGFDEWGLSAQLRFVNVSGTNDFFSSILASVICAKNERMASLSALEKKTKRGYKERVPAGKRQRTKGLPFAGVERAKHSKMEEREVLGAEYTEQGMRCTP